MAENQKQIEAYTMWKNGGKINTISAKLDIPERTLHNWMNKFDWADRLRLDMDEILEAASEEDKERFKQIRDKQLSIIEMAMENLEKQMELGNVKPQEFVNLMRLGQVWIKPDKPHFEIAPHVFEVNIIKPNEKDNKL